MERYIALLVSLSLLGCSNSVLIHKRDDKYSPLSIFSCLTDIECGCDEHKFTNGTHQVCSNYPSDAIESYDRVGSCWGAYSLCHEGEDIFTVKIKRGEYIALCGTGDKCCPSGSYLSTVTKECEFCREGEEVNPSGGNVCTPCRDLWSSDPPNQPHCIPCTGRGLYLKSKRECGICPEGSEPNRTSCRICPPGTFSPDGIRCIPCGRGSISRSNSSSCTLCKSGSITMDSVTCTPCEVGEKEFERVTCLKCPLGTYSQDEGSSECAPCHPGTYGSSNRSDICFPCQRGTYQDRDGETSCKRCPPGTYQPLFGSTQCLTCPSGYFCTGGDTTPVPSPPGTYSPSGSSNWTQCREGTYSLSNSSECLPCYPGYEPSLSRSECIICPHGSVSPSGVLCILCSRGSFTDSNHTQCTLCPQGRYEVNFTCVKTSPGSYSDQLGSVNQTLCPPGTYSSVEEVSRCNETGGSDYNPTPGGTSPLPCPLGVPNVEHTDCFCPPGKVEVNGTCVCYGFKEEVSLEGGSRSVCICPLHSVWDHLQLGCECIQGRVWNGTECICKSRTFPSGSECICPSGSYVTQGECIPCSAGTYSPLPSSLSCSDSPPGSYSPPGSPSTTPCPVNTYTSLPSSSHCEPCPEGQWALLPGSTSCESCPSGTHPNLLTHVCETNPPGYDCCDGGGLPFPCPPGTYINSLTRHCSPCSCGTYSLTEGSLECSKCPKGTFTHLGVNSCTPCEIGTYSDSLGSCECKSCSPFISLPLSEGSQECSECPPGMYSLDGFNCIEIPPGFDCSTCSPGVPISECSPGSYSPGGLDQCLLCPQGTYGALNQSVSQDSCIPCPQFSISPQGSSQCTECPSDQVPNLTHSQCIDTPCLPGSYPLLRECIPCPEGTYSHTGLECVPCTSYHFCPEGSSDPLGCAPGYQSINQGPCLPCLPGSVSGGGECTQCSAGTFTLDSIHCLQCQPGTYSSPGSINCTLAGNGTYVNGTGECSPSVCPPTYTSNLEEGGTYCVPCPDGFYSLVGICLEIPGGEIQIYIHALLEVGLLVYPSNVLPALMEHSLR
jgi:hypothetical protein